MGPPGSISAYLGELTLKTYGILDKIHKSSLGFAESASALNWPWKESLWDASRREQILPGDFADLMGK